MEIIVKNYELKSLASEMSNYSEELGEEIKKIRNIVENIEVSWQGPDAAKYINALKERYILGLEELKEIINEYTVYLNNLPEAYELLDNVYSSKHIGV